MDFPGDEVQEADSAKAPMALGCRAANRDEGIGSEIWGELRMEFGLAAGQEHDFELALLALGEGGTRHLDLFPIGRCVGKLERAAAADLEAIVEGCAGGEAIDPEAGVGVIEFEELDGSAGAVLDGGVDVVGVARGSSK